MTKMKHWRRERKLGRLTSGSNSPLRWSGRPVERIQADLKIISDAWEGTRADRQAWRTLKAELEVAKLEEARLLAKAKRQETTNG